MDGLDVICEDPRWAALERLAHIAVPGALSHQGLLPANHEIAVLGCDDARIAALNATFRDKAQATNVLAWPAEDLAPGDTPPQGLGDIAIAYETCTREALEQAKAIDAHVLHLLVHATLHLLGYDHQNAEEAAEMERIETEILGKLGVSDPY